MTPNLPDQAFAVALSCLPGMGPARLSLLLRRWSPPDAWQRVATGRAHDDGELAGACRPDPARLASAWRAAAAGVNVEGVWRAHVDAGITVHLHGAPGYPEALAGDHEPPAVLFCTGDVAVLDGPRVAIVGTRRCTRYGRDIAHQLGRDLAAEGVRVVSGLALGIDGAAHHGALDAGGGPPVGVVGSGLDVVYPRRHARLWTAVSTAGVLLTEAPMRAPPEPWRFPVRNRVIAALAHVVVVVESHATGGSMHTVDAAAARDRPVLAVPGPVRSPASEGTNALLADGCHPARDAGDVFVALGLTRPGARNHATTVEPSDPVEAAVLDAIGWEAASLDDIVLRSGLPPSTCSVALVHLERDGVVRGGAGWWERLGCRSGGGRGR